MVAGEKPVIIKKERVWRLLIRVKKLLEKNNIPYWIESGTLLGFIREKGFLDTFKNVNIGIHAEFIEKFKTVNFYSILGYRFKPSYDRSGYKWIDGYCCGFFTQPLILFEKNIPLHITPRFAVGDTVRWIDGINGRICKSVSSHYYKKLDTVSINGITFPIPQDTEKYLAERYGDWKIPCNDWNTNINDRVIVDKKELVNLYKKTRNSDRIGRFNTRMRLSNKDLLRAKKMLEDTVTILERNNIPYWLDAGTLLGIIRDSAFIPWDNDVDISVSSKYIEQVLALKKQFFPKYRLLTRFEYSGRLPGIYRSCKVKLTLGKLSVLIKKEELHLDIFFKYKVDNYYCWIDSNITKRVDARFHDKLDTIQWNGRSYSIPYDIEAYLTQRYGDWHKRVEDYDPSIHDCAIFE